MLRKINDVSALSLRALRAEAAALASPSKAMILSGFFKTGPGQYGEGDVFIGLVVPQCRQLAKKYLSLGPAAASELLESPVHEERLTALLMLCELYRKGSPEEKKAIYDFYMAGVRWINNWDLVDLSAPKIVGPHLEKASREPLFRLVHSANLWERRMAVVACFHFIRKSDFADFLKIAEVLLHDKHDLIHKAAGWMLREAGKRDKTVLEGFLSEHASVMPRTMLRYAIEKLPPKQRKAVLESSRK
ncbi:MAG: DNA alkylation repair protein [Elusimicrobia bacterium]|nr:DNA alkylation repair protein [Elusimicrobiota bacterium]